MALSESKNREVILIIMAMRGEAKPIIDKLKLSRAESTFAPVPILVYQGELDGKSIVLLVNGVHEPTQMDLIGTQNATLTTILGIQKFKPSKIFNFGTCGALSAKGAKVGDLYLVVDRVWFHTRRIPIPGWEEMGLGGHMSSGTKDIAKRHGLKTGTLSSTDSLDFPLTDSAVFGKVDADVADMEGAAIAWLAEMHKIPFYAIKGVTDLMDCDRKTGEQFEENFDNLVSKISSAAVALVCDIA